MMRNPRWPRFWPRHVVIGIARLGSIGSLKAPGTWGSVFGVLLYVVVFYGLDSWLAQLLVMLGLLYFAVGICGEAERRLNKVDPGEIVLDEVVAMPICFFGLKPFFADGYAWLILLVGFGVFRFFDILKPIGIKKLQRYYGGFGVVVDDVAAAVATCVVMNIAVRLIAMA